MVVLILSNTANPEYYQLLENCVNSVNQYCKVLVVETNHKLKRKNIPLKAEFLFPREEFNYNRFLNIGISHILRTDDKFIISNNDVIFHPGCVQEISSKLSTYDSVSPVDTNNTKHTNVFPNVVEGYDIGNHITGCCIGLTKQTYEKIGKFDETFKFWYQDNDYANLLKHYNLKHALLRDAKITHIGFQSHKLLGEKHLEMTHGLEKTYNEKWVK